MEVSRLDRPGACQTSYEQELRWGWLVLLFQHTPERLLPFGHYVSALGPAWHAKRNNSGVRLVEARYPFQHPYYVE